MPTDTIPARLFARAASDPDRPAYHVREADGWKATSHEDYAAEVLRAARAMIALGLEPGGTVCIAGFNRPEWTTFDLAAMCAGGAPAGIYTTSPEKDVAYILEHSQATLVLVEDAVQLAKIRGCRERLPKLVAVVGMRGLAADDILTWEAFLDQGEVVPEQRVLDLVAALADDELATLVYTSGTTGFPKGVMLSHRNLAWTASCARDLVDIGPDDCSVSYLPLSHIAEQMFSLHIPITVGASIYFARSMEKLAEDVKEVQPTIFFGVPRVWEKFHAAVSAKIAEATGAKKILLGWAQDVGRKASVFIDRGEPVPFLLRWQYDLAGKVIYGKLKPALGLGRARACVSGAAPITKDVLDFFTGLDVRIYEVYGQSEDSGPTSFNAPGRRRAGTVGPALPGVDVKIAEDGEILVRGPNVFLGYFRDPEATAATLRDGWLHSGDVGEFDADGFLRITGRKKEILITAGGKNIAPIRIESALKSLDLVAEAVAIADRRRFVSALIVLEPTALERLARAQGIPVTHDHPKLREVIEAEVARVNAELMQVEHVRKFHVLSQAFSVETGELTPSLKVKRRVVEQKYADVIEAMYAE